MSSVSSSVSGSEIHKRFIYMNVAKARPVPETSFEENRMYEYVQAYQTTGRPPQPLPHEPIDAADRARLGLLPLFEPYSEIGGLAVPLDPQTLRRIHTRDLASPAQSSRSADLTAVPDVQVFTPSTLRTSDTDPTPQQFQSIVVQEQYTAFSFEELRYRAYLAGKRYVPEAVAAAPVAPSPVDPSEQYQSITCQPAYAQHSFEELRLAHSRAHHELTSDQIIQHRIL